ncbi:unnamed protein product [Prorocentrum cordatum]|uniref:DNA (cytosine-5-)-methyltransferase n=1 Tax=Prorocentrum cordatum TaxID=2364126 RepID=A0ABN9Q4Q1_9DINO|nr:unnamed protein product [Polarella glacialis]
MVRYCDGCTLRVHALMVKIRLGTDFTGLNAPLLALWQLGVPVDHVFSCDKEPAVQRFNAAAMPAQHLYDDIEQRDHSLVPEVDYYHFSPPCQSFSAEGVAGRPVEGDDARDALFRHSLAYIANRTPKLVTYEMVPNIKIKQHRWAMREIKAELEALRYTVQVKTLHCEDHGVPHHRHRLFMVACRDGWAKPFTWPKPVGFKRTLAEILTKYRAHLKEKINPAKTIVITDIGRSLSRGNSSTNLTIEGLFPCTTNRRANALDYWISVRGRRVTLPELFELSGIDCDLQEKLAAWSSCKTKVSAGQMGAMIGNTIPVNIMERVLQKALWASGLATRRLPDRCNQKKTKSQTTNVTIIAANLTQQGEAAGGRPCRRPPPDCAPAALSMSPKKRSATDAGASAAKRPKAKATSTPLSADPAESPHDEQTTAVPELSGVNADYFTHVQKRLATIKQHVVLQTAFADSVEPVAVSDGAVVPPIDIGVVAKKLESMDANIEGATVVGTGSVPLAWIDTLMNPTPGVQINMSDVDLFIKRDFKKTSALPSKLRTIAIALTEHSTEPFVAKKLQSLSAFEKLHAPIKACADEVDTGTMTDARARDWLKLFRQVPTEVYRVNQADIATAAFTLREDAKDEAHIVSWTTLQRIQIVIREKYMLKLATGKDPTEKQLETHFEKKVHLAAKSEKLSSSFIDIANTVQERALRHKGIAETINTLDRHYKHAGPTFGIGKFQIVINKCKTALNIEWCYNYLLDALSMEFIELSDCSISKMNTWICDLALIKLSSRDYFLNQWAHSNAFTAEEIGWCRNAFASHESARATLTNYPGASSVDISSLYVSGAGTKRRNAFRLAVAFWEKIAFGNDFDTALKTAAKNAKGPEEYLAEYTAFEEDLTELKEELKKEQQQAIAMVYAINEFITKKIPTDVTDPRADECKKYLGMAERIARSLTRVVTIPANMATMIEDIKSSAMAMAKRDTLALPGAPLPSRCCGV